MNVRNVRNLDELTDQGFVTLRKSLHRIEVIVRSNSIPPDVSISPEGTLHHRKVTAHGGVFLTTIVFHGQDYLPAEAYKVHIGDTVFRSTHAR